MKIFNILEKSAFASAERKTENEIQTESQEINSREAEISILNMLPDLIIILNNERQALFLNNAMLNFLSLKDSSSVLGLRPGEILDCVNSENDSGGCGTTEFCSVCQAVKAIISAQDGNSAVDECEIIKVQGGAYNLKVWAFPFGENTLFIMCNIEDEVYRNSLEHIFFRDLANISSGMSGLLNMIHGNCEKFLKYENLLVNLSNEILEEINSQQDLLLAEQGTMHVKWDIAHSMEILKFVVEIASRLEVAAGKNIEILEDSVDVEFKTDVRLLKRIIISMVKNALEASPEGATVQLGTTSKKGNVIFEVHNDSYIPRETQLKIFNRAFTTKGKGRGLGTYSMKLLSENYLNGTVYFTSDENNGTFFWGEYPIEPESA